LGRDDQAGDYSANLTNVCAIGVPARLIADEPGIDPGRNRQLIQKFSSRNTIWKTCELIGKLSLPRALIEQLIAGGALIAGVCRDGNCCGSLARFG